jgi:enoyl-CoA hydratase
MVPDLKTVHIVAAPGGVAELLLAGPDGNPCGQDFWRDLPIAIAALTADPEVRAIVIRTDGPHFTYGLDLVGLGPDLARAAADGLTGRLALLRIGRQMQAAFDAVADSPKPVIAAVNGRCIGAGVELLAACDLRLCSADARFSLREVKVGFVADLGGLQRLPFIIGEGHARWMALTGDDVRAERAREVGLVTEVLPDRAALVAAARELAGRIAANPPNVLAGIKQVMNGRIDAAVRASLREALHLNSSLAQSEDFAEAMAAFREGRAPSFTGR